MQANWDACHGLWNNSRILARLARKFEACQPPRASAGILFDREHLKNSTEHFRM